jgi:hypothetical protein
MERLFYFCKEWHMAKARIKSTTGKIFENILFLADVFGDRADQDIPKLPILEMAQCFDLEVSRAPRSSRRRGNSWPLWK